MWPFFILVVSTSPVDDETVVSQFYLTSESFTNFPIWVQLPYLPFHLWVESLLEVVGDAIGYFQVVDSKSLNILHTNNACILVVVDISKGFPEKIKLEVPNGSWIQTLDYEGIPF